jgi:hypothetical protein
LTCSLRKWNLASIFLLLPCRTSYQCATWLAFELDMLHMNQLCTLSHKMKVSLLAASLTLTPLEIWKITSGTPSIYHVSSPTSIRIANYFWPYIPCRVWKQNSKVKCTSYVLKIVLAVFIIVTRFAIHFSTRYEFGYAVRNSQRIKYAGGIESRYADSIRGTFKLNLYSFFLSWWKSSSFYCPIPYLVPSLKNLWNKTHHDPHPNFYIVHSYNF